VRGALGCWESARPGTTVGSPWLSSKPRCRGGGGDVNAEGCESGRCMCGNELVLKRLSLRVRVSEMKFHHPPPVPLPPPRSHDSGVASTSPTAFWLSNTSIVGTHVSRNNGSMDPGLRSPNSRSARTVGMQRSECRLDNRKRILTRSWPNFATMWLGCSRTPNSETSAKSRAHQARVLSYVIVVLFLSNKTLFNQQICYLSYIWWE
jgi:hypothetical protein